MHRSGTGGEPIPLPTAAAIRTAGVVADARLSGELIETLATICRRPVIHGSNQRIADGEGDRLIYVGPGLPENLRDGRLLWLHSTNAGVDALLRDGRWPPEVLLTRTVGRMAERIAQYVLTWILAESQNVPAFLDQQRNRTWRRLPAQLVEGRVAVVFGVGRIGAAVCELLHRCGIRTVGVAGHPRPVSGCDRVIGIEQVPEVLPGARWVVSALPLTRATTGMFDRDLFASLKGATFINVGRGATVDVGALAAALTNGTVGRAVLDVLAEEPPGEDADYWDLPRTVVTSHSAGITTDEDVAGDFAACLGELESGRVPRLAVSPGRGY